MTNSATLHMSSTNWPWRLKKNRHSRRRWVADIAHELRTPLAVLRGELDTIEDGVRQFDRGTRQSLQAEVARLEKLVNELHDLTMYDEDNHSYKRETINVSAVLQDSIDHATKRLNDADIGVESPIAKTAILVEADATKLERVFSNLIEHTLRYINSSGRLVVLCVEKKRSSTHRICRFCTRHSRSGPAATF